jgi:DnaD/phage-associated family protein
VNALQGWVSIHRKIMNNPIWQDSKLLKLWMLCLLEASHKDHEQLVGKQIIKLHPGQFVTGRFSLAKSYNEGVKKVDIVPEITLWRWLKFLETNDFLNIKSTTKYSVVTIKNWNHYQENEQQMNNKRTTNEQQMNTNNNGNKGNNEKNNNTTTNAEKRIMDFWDANGFGFTNINAKNKLLMFLDEGLEEDVILRALEIASNNNKVSYSYVEKVLIDWSKRGLKTLNLVQAAEMEREQQKKQKQARTGSYKKPIRKEQTPEWFEENHYEAPIPVHKVDETGKQAIMDKLNQFRK